MDIRKTFLFSHPACLDHDTGEGHPESRARLTAVLNALALPEFSRLERRSAPLVERDDLLLAHPISYVDAIFGKIPQSGLWNLDPDTIVSKGSGEAALRACGAVCAAVDAVVSERGSNGFCAIRPPGHHAEASRAQGFCLFNNVAVAAFAARKRHGIRRVAVVDFDVHHGNGTQSMFWNEPDFLYASSHQSPFYPGTGAATEYGACRNILNLPLKAGTGSGEFRQIIEAALVPRLNAFAPELVLVSAGFDAHADDPLANMNLKTEDFFWVAQQLQSVADRNCAGRLVASLEGGYDLDALAASAAAFVRGITQVAA